MEWTNRGVQSPQSVNEPSAGGTSRRGGGKAGIFKSLRIVSVALLFCITIVIVALIAYLIVGPSTKSEDKYVNSKEMQAVFLNGGQVYFGNISSLNSKYLSMKDIYYLRVNQTVQPNGNTASNQDISLVKLGCELHGPEDQMIINRDQVVFWENLKSDGQVAKAVAQYKQQNPQGQNCSNTSQSSNSSTPTNSSTPSTNTTTPTTNSTTKKQ